MQNNNKRDYSKKEYLRNGTKTQNQVSKNQFVNTVEQPRMNESGMEAKKKGFWLIHSA